MTLRVATFNVLASAYADWPARRRVIAAGLARLRPDVVALQEVIIAPELAEVEQLLGPGWYLAPHTRTGPDGVGAVMASRWPLSNVRHADLEFNTRAAQFPWSGTTAALATVPSPFGPVLFVHHKPVYQWGFEYERERQAVLAAEFVEELVARTDHHVVVLGDFDAAPETASVRFWTGRQSLHGTSVSYHDAWESAHPDTAGHTFTPENPLVRAGDMPLTPPRRIDYVLVRGTPYGPTLQVRSCERIFVAPDDNGVQASDHYGVLAEFAVPGRPPGEMELPRSPAARPEQAASNTQFRTELPR
ncbi:endonuclease/exonuclease/phosphatase family protein [Nocardia brasiliensis]|uniref:endonuclease/exonuclease/phosphatase family protein n=1 Tax=Nocardia brasiliensis TaxID=37326 RepID=UPI00189531F2|nr:endonuclease/exonuclease/phosphatase family protein [Nocardia brasiliensis]MBF6124402.1 endonuclease/exonuclease/phosphatase family protein [Nocardia brasiliensis]